MSDHPSPPVSPYLTVANATEAAAFYTRAFGAHEIMRMPAEDGKRLLHVSMTINGGLLMMSDDFPEHNGGVPGTPQEGRRSPVTIHLEVEDVDAAMAKAAEAGAKVTMPAQDMFWGQRYGRLVDPFGHQWAMTGPLAKKS